MMRNHGGGSVFERKERKKYSKVERKKEEEERDVGDNGGCCGTPTFITLSPLVSYFTMPYLLQILKVNIISSLSPFPLTNIINGWEPSSLSLAYPNHPLVLSPSFFKETCSSILLIGVEWSGLTWGVISNMRFQTHGYGE